MLRVPAPRCAPIARFGLVAAATLLAACTSTGVQDVLNPRGPQAARIADWFWLSYALGIGVFVAFVVVLGLGLVRAERRQRRGEPNELQPSHGRNLVLWGGLVVPALILLSLLVASTYTDRRLARLGIGTGSEPLTVEITGHQFWWEIRYRDPLPARRFTTANELHIPAGEPVRLILQSRDVIHSFWAPNLHGKQDLIPGRKNELVIQADEPGVYRGQCAEFCGVQHAKMSILVIAHPPEEFAAWWERQLRPHEPPTDPVLASGHDVFMRNGCALCHAISGTMARGEVAPNLSHLASRRTIAAGTLPNTRGNLGGWIADPQGIKPGSHMPAVPVDGESLQHLLSYLQSLR